MIKKVTPFLMYHDSMKEVIEFYSSIFKKDFKILSSSNGPESDMATFEIHGQIIHAYNGGKYFTFTESFSLMIDCETQDDVDYLWEKLSEGGAKSQCGWVKDKFGLSWQIIPAILMKMIGDKDRVKANRATQAMLKMSKIEIAELEKAFNQE
jgi:predicted 3-demethylubiquinone-9 3-methyltransferase (glyoxalase superfamily)